MDSPVQYVQPILSSDFNEMVKILPKLSTFVFFCNLARLIGFDTRSFFVPNLV